MAQNRAYFEPSSYDLPFIPHPAMHTHASPQSRAAAPAAAEFMASRPFVTPAHAEPSGAPASGRHELGAVSVSAATAPAAPGSVIQLNGKKNKKKGGGKKQKQDPYASASGTVGTYRMDETWQHWLRVGQKAGHPAPQLTGHGSAKGGGKAEKERLKLITEQLTNWRSGLLENLQVTQGMSGKDLKLNKLKKHYEL
jgi:hypothetical protein